MTATMTLMMTIVVMMMIKAMSLKNPIVQKFAFLGILAFKGALCLRMLEIQVPASLALGEPVSLNCTFDLEGDILYSIKWYKKSVEFYRYIPSEKPPGQRYELRGIYLDDNFLHGRSVRLERTDLDSEGRYRCEVSAESPSFQTVMDEKELRIYVMPDRDPIISGYKNKYRIGEDVNMTCMSGPSKPPSFLQWDINGKEVPVPFTSSLPPLRHTDGLLSSRLALRFLVEPAHFSDGIMRLRCSAFVAKARSTTRSAIVATNRIKVSGHHVESNDNGPTITGSRLRYQESNVVNVNCTAARAHPPAELRWYINDKEANSDYLRNYEPIRFPDGKRASVLGLRFTVKSTHFQRGEMKLECTATLFEVTDVRKVEMTFSSRNRQSSSGLHVYISRANGLEPETQLILSLALCIASVLRCAMAIL